MNNYQLNPLLESEGLLKVAPKKARDGVAWYLRKIRKGSKLDPVMVASTVSPVPGGVVIGNSYTKAIDPSTRARAYRLALDRPDKAFVKGLTGVPDSIVKTLKNVPKSASEFIDDTGYKATRIGLKHGIDPMKYVYYLPLK